MRKGISITVTPADRVRLQSIIRDRNSPQKHVWRARIIALTADDNRTTAIMRAVGKGKTVVWRWQERFMHEGIAGLTRDKTRPSRIPPLPAETVDRVAREVGAHQIVMGTRGLGNLGNLFLGSVATKVVRLTRVPVTLVK